MKDFEADSLNFNVDAALDPQAYVRSTIDLMVLGFQTDMTRVMTYMMAREDGMGFGENFPKLALGTKKATTRSLTTNPKVTGNSGAATTRGWQANLLTS